MSKEEVVCILISTILDPSLLKFIIIVYNYNCQIGVFIVYILLQMVLCNPRCYSLL